MPLSVPPIDPRKYQDLLDEALARIPVHTPEWTNFNESDPGVTLVEVFAFLTENLLYVANQVPERNRLKFLTLLGVPLQPATAARGLVTFNNERGPLETITLSSGFEVGAGSVPFRVRAGLDVLPVEAQVYTKRRLDAAPPAVADYYRQLYASFGKDDPGAQLAMYQPVQFSPQEPSIDLTATVDGALWVALLARKDEPVEVARERIAGRVLSLGLVPLLDASSRRLPPGGRTDPAAATVLKFDTPLGPALPASRVPAYQPRGARTFGDLQAEPVVVEVELPDVGGLTPWLDLDPLESGTGDFPPALDDADAAERLITWVRVSAPPQSSLRFIWAGINAARVEQRARVAGELLPNGTGEPDQTARLANAPVLPGTVMIEVTAPTADRATTWTAIDDLMAAGPEVVVRDPRTPPGAAAPPPAPSAVFAVDYESGVVRFGDGAHGRRPPFGAVLRATYDYAEGAEGNVGPGAISTAPALPAGIKVTNPIATWGGADAETVAQGERQVARYLQHRDRLVTAEDFLTITQRTPGVEIGRVEVLAAYNPDLVPADPGDAPGAVTLMVIPASDPLHPDAPEPDCHFLDAICDYLDPRRLVTTEVFLRGPEYVDIWISVGVEAANGFGAAEVREGVRAALLAALSPLPEGLGSEELAAEAASPGGGWPLRKDVIAQELSAIAARQTGVLFVIGDVQLAQGNQGATPTVPMRGLQLPRVRGISVEVGPAVPVGDLRGVSRPATEPKLFPVPVVPEGCA